MLFVAISAVFPLLAIVLAGAASYRYKILPESSTTVLNGFVYYFTLPALLFYSLATTPFGEILQLDFLGGYTAAMLTTYLLTLTLSVTIFKSHYTVASIRALSASFCNSAYLGIPIMLHLFNNSHEALLITTLAIILPTLLIIIAVGTLELHKATPPSSRLRTLLGIAKSILKTPIIGASFAGGLFSLWGLELPITIATSLKSFGMASIPCSLFAVGITIVKLKMKFTLSRILTLNSLKLILHPLLAALFLLLFRVSDHALLMGIILSGLPPATLVCVMAETYSIKEGETAATLLSATIFYTPLLYLTLIITNFLGLTLN